MCLLTFLFAVPETVRAAAPGTGTEGSAQGAEEGGADKEEENPGGEAGGNTGNTGNAGDDNGLTDQNSGELSFYFNMGEGGSLTSTLQIMLLIMVISLAPSILIMVTSFTRIIVVLHFTRTAVGMQTTPPNQVMIGLALFLTVFLMAPIFSEINEQAIQPLSAGEITQEEAFERGIEPLRGFMFDQTDTKDLKLFLKIAGYSSLESRDDCPTSVLIPAFIISELRMAFIIGFIIYIPFIIIDMVVASTLMSMGMMMLPPTTISMPFKILLFIMADGWNLVIEQLIATFRQ